VDLLAITAQLSVTNGTVLNEGSVPGLLAQPAPQKAARGRERDYLFAHLTLTGQQEETADLARELIEGMGRRFFAGSGSVTSALRRAVIEINEQLLRHNLTAKASHEGALSCAVLHGGELYSLQVGEGLAFLGHNFGVERLPAKAPDVLTPLGRSAGIDIRFAYHQLQNGDMMLLADPRLAYLTGESLAPVLVDTEIESGLESLIDVLAGDSARLLLVEFADELPSTLPLTFQHSRNPAPKPAPARAKAAERLAVPTAAPIRATTTTEPSVEPEEAYATQTGFGIDPSQTAASVEVGARRVASTSARGLSRFTGWLAAVLGRLQREETDEPAVHWAIPTTVALLVPIIMASVLTSVYIQRDTVARLADIKQEMMAELSAADNAGGGSAEAQAHYLRVLALAGEAEALREGDLDVARMRSQVHDALDRLDGVTRLAATTLYRYGQDANLTRIALRGAAGGVAVLNQSANRVMFHPTDESYQTLTTEEPQVLAFGGQAVGTQTVGTLFDVLWLPGSAAATRDSISMLDRSGRLFSFYPNLGDTSSAVLGNSSQWVNPVSMATYLDRIYVLDTEAGEIWKYYASSNYAQLPDDATIVLAEGGDLDQAVDFDLYAEDGSLVILYADGRIRYYDTRTGRIQWDENMPAQNGLATPFIAPVSVKLVGSGLNASIFVLDPGSGRLIQLSRGGIVLTQYRILDENGGDVLSRASDFAVTESPLRVLVAAGERIYLADR